MRFYFFHSLLVKLFLCILFLTSSFTTYALEKTIKYTRTEHRVSSLNSEQIIEALKKGNERFLSGNMVHRNYNKQAILTSKIGQAPYAVILSCMDSRGPVEILLDQGIGDIFSLRIAGNVLNKDILGSMEYGTKVIGAKVIVIMGHTQCGAVKAACKSVQLGNLSTLLNQIKPAVRVIVGLAEPHCNEQNVDKIARQNVMNIVKNLKTQSPIIGQLVKNKDLLIVGAMHNLSNGKIEFFDDKEDITQ